MDEQSGERKQSLINKADDGSSMPVFQEMESSVHDRPAIRDDAESWETVMFWYNSALKKVRTKMDILNDEFCHIHRYNPIEYIQSRIKTPESICKKLQRYGKECTTENMVKYINDIAGVRVVCSFTSDIYRLADMIRLQSDLTILSVKDYFSHPKENGYKSYHMLVTIPIYMSTGTVDTKVEIQIRTIAMDFWASLEHKIYYKFEGNAPKYISEDLKECAEIVSNLDAKMLQLNEAILQAKEHPQKVNEPGIDGADEPNKAEAENDCLDNGGSAASPLYYANNEIIQ